MNGGGGNGQLIIGRSGLSPSCNLGNPILGGFGSLSTSTSPIITTPDDMLSSSDNLPVVIGGSNVNNPVSSFTHPPRSIKLAPMQIRCKFGQLGPSKGQFNSPHGFCLGTDEDIVVADTNNHRVQVRNFIKLEELQF